MKIPRDWTFKKFYIAKGFDRHVREQLPWYDLATGIVKHIARHYLNRGGLVYDIGASTGNVGKAISDIVKNRGASLIAIDNSEEMVKLYSGPGKIELANAEEYEYKNFDIAICFLSLLFLSQEKRKYLIQRLLGKVRKGGAIIIFDKEEPSKGYVSIIKVRLALAGKLASGATAKEIIEKELSLSGIQRPISKNELPREAQEIFRFGDFFGVIIEG
jgi:tRNA (cmo5U34)-methyltransferase